MWNFFAPPAVERHGLRQTRRTVTESKFTEALECAWPIRLLIFGGFVGGLAALIFRQQEEPAKKFCFVFLFLSPLSPSSGSTSRRPLGATPSR